MHDAWSTHSLGCCSTASAFLFLCFTSPFSFSILPFFLFSLQLFPLLLVPFKFLSVATFLDFGLAKGGLSFAELLSVLFVDLGFKFLSAATALDFFLSKGGPSLAGPSSFLFVDLGFATFSFPLLTGTCWLVPSLSGCFFLVCVWHAEWDSSELFAFCFSS